MSEDAHHKLLIKLTFMLFSHRSVLSRSGLVVLQ